MDFFNNVLTMALANPVFAGALVAIVLGLILGRWLTALGAALAGIGASEAALQYGGLSLVDVVQKMAAPLVDFSSALGMATLAGLGAVLVVVIGSEISLRKAKKQAAAVQAENADSTAA